MMRPSPDVVRPPTANALSSVCRERALPPPREGMNRGLSGGVVVPLSTWTGAYLPLQEAASSCQRDSLGAVIRASQYGELVSKGLSSVTLAVGLIALKKAALNR